MVAGNAFFVGSEIAITSARRSRIKQLADLGNKSAKAVQRLHEEPERFFSVTQIGITLVSLALGAIGMVTITEIIDAPFVSFFVMFGDGPGLVKWAHTTSHAVVFFIISFLHVVAGELAPKVLAFHKAECSRSFAVTALGRRVKKIDSSQFEIDASVRVSDLEPIVNFPFPLDEDYVTLGGLVLKTLGHIPKVGDVVDLEAGRLVVMGMDNHRITKILFQDLAVGDDGQMKLADPPKPKKKGAGGGAGKEGKGGQPEKETAPAETAPTTGEPKKSA